MTGGFRFEARPRVALGVVCAAAFLVRLLHVLSYETIPTNDMAIFVEMAREKLTWENLFRPEGICFYTPGYALFLKAFYLVLSPEAAERAAQVVQAALGAGTCLLVHRIARRLHSRRAGLVAAALTCFFGHFVYYTSHWMSENLFIPVYYAAVLLLIRAARRRVGGSFFQAGLAIGAAGLVRPAGLSLGLGALAAAWAAGSAAGGASSAPARARARLGALGLTAAGAAALLLPWGIRNLIASGHFVLLAPYGAANLAVGNNPDPDGITPRGFPPPPSGGIFEQSAYYRARVSEFVASDPVGALQITLRQKWQGLWETVVPWPLHSFNPMLLWGEHHLPSLGWRWTLVLGLMGSLVARRGAAGAVLLAAFAGNVAFWLVFWGRSRYRMPAEGYFLAWAGIAVVAAARWIPRAARARAPAWAAALTALVAAALVESAADAAITRRHLTRPEHVIATGDQIPVVNTEASIPIFGKEAIPLDGARGRHLRLSFTAFRQGPHRKTPANGVVRITYLNRAGRPLDYVENPAFVLTALPSGRWVTVTLKSWIPTAAASVTAALVPDRGSPDTLILDQPVLRYARGNDLAFEFLFPRLRFRE